MRVRHVIIARLLGLLVCMASTGSAGHAATVTATVTANNVKPLVIVKLTDLNLGSVMLSPGMWSNATVSLAQTGALSCTSANLTCTGATGVASYNVQGSKQQVVQISAPNVTLVNQGDSTKTLTLAIDAPASIILANSGFPGSNFSVGGSVTLNSNTAAGTYVGTMNVTVDY